jgi:hypothetical protein
MKRLATAGVCLALALLTFFEFPGHTWLQQDTQIYVPILEHQRDASVLRNDILVQHPHVAYTLYDEISLALRGLTSGSFRSVLAAQQIVTRTLGIWGLLMLAEALGLTFLPAVTVATICSLGAWIAGPQVLTIEYEPTPRAFAVPLLICAMGLAARRRYPAAGIAAGGAFLYHAPTTLPVLAGLAVVLCRGRADDKIRSSLPLAAAVAILLFTAHGQGQQSFFTALTPAQVTLQHVRTAYVWVSTWPAATIVRHLLIFAVFAGACARVWRVMTPQLRVLLLVVPILGLLSMPLSWLLLEHWNWGLVPQVQPMRALLFVTLAMQFMTASAGAMAKNRLEAAIWFSLAFYPACESLWALAFGAATALAGARFSPAVALAAFFVIPSSYPRLHTPELVQLSDWARTDTPKDAVFLFPDAGHGLAPGIFRSEALRAVYVDWKGGGQINYLREFGDDWWFRWQQTVARGYRPEDMPKYAGLGVNYIVLGKRTAEAPLYENAGYAVYRVR